MEKGTQEFHELRILRKGSKLYGNKKPQPPWCFSKNFLSFLLGIFWAEISLPPISIGGCTASISGIWHSWPWEVQPHLFFLKKICWFMNHPFFDTKGLSSSKGFTHHILYGCWLPRWYSFYIGPHPLFFQNFPSWPDPTPGWAVPLYNWVWQRWIANPWSWIDNLSPTKKVGRSSGQNSSFYFHLKPMKKRREIPTK